MHMNPKYLLIFALVLAVLGGTAVSAQDDPLAMNKAVVERHILEVFNQADDDAFTTSSRTNAPACYALPG
jgi:hypothetical protein